MTFIKRLQRLLQKPAHQVAEDPEKAKVMKRQLEIASRLGALDATISVKARKPYRGGRVGN